jgi:tryptophanyl-tRNA synthetase
MSKIVFSGVQPSGVLHIGNYLGAIKNWADIVSKAEQGDSFIFSVVDLHAITVHQKPEDLRKSIYKTIAAYIACGLDSGADNVTLFVQSTVKEHAELGWILSCNTNLGWLDRMTQYKSKTQANKERECLGLYSYPVLMAADILLYGTHIVPVGEDQVQHIELARDIAEKMNSLYKKTLFTVPKYQLVSEAKRIMSLKDGLSKMSKSEPDDASRINLDDTADIIAKKIKRAATDSITGIYMAEGRAAVNNLIAIFAAFSGLSTQQVSMQYQSCQTSVFKSDLTELLVSKLSPIAKTIAELEGDTTMLDNIIKNGQQKASQVAERNIRTLKQNIGIYF